MTNVLILLRAVTYSALFAGLVLVFLPSRVLEASGIVKPDYIGIAQVGGMAITACGAMLVLWCVLTFAMVGRGTPAPFDPPRRLVIRGPYRRVRNPMYIGAGLALTGAALFYKSVLLLGYAGSFLALVHLLVVLYEEPALRKTFGEEYDGYCRRVGRWRPRAQVDA